MLFQIALLTAAALQSPAVPRPAGTAPTIVGHQLTPPIIVGEAADVPITFNAAGMPTVPISIGGKEVRVVFDTGAPGPLRLTERLARELGLTPTGTTRVSDPSGRNAFTIPMFKLDSMRLGDIEIRNWAASGSPPRPGPLGMIDGIIGPTAFAGYVVSIDYAGKRLSIRRGALPAADGKSVFEHKDDPIATIPLEIEGKRIAAHVDTGNGAGALIVPESFAKQLSRAAEAKVVGRAQTVSNVIEVLNFPVTGVVKAGAVSLPVTSVTFPSIASVANIGSKALTGMIVRVDPANARVALEPGPSGDLRN